MPKSDNIKKIIKRIDEIVLSLKEKNITEEDKMEDYFWNNHSDIMNTYPFLVCQIISGADREMLNYMLKTLDRVENGEQDQNDADVEIGQKIVDDLIKPNLK